MTLRTPSLLTIKLDSQTICAPNSNNRDDLGCIPEGHLSTASFFQTGCFVVARFLLTIKARHAVPLRYQRSLLYVLERRIVAAPASNLAVCTEITDRDMNDSVIRHNLFTDHASDTLVGGSIFVQLVHALYMLSCRNR